MMPFRSSIVARKFCPMKIDHAPPRLSARHWAQMRPNEPLTPSPAVTRRLLVTLLAAAAFAPSAPAQTIDVGAPVQSSFSAKDPRRSDGSPYRIYWFTAQGGERLVVQMTAPLLDSYLMVGRRPTPGAASLDDLVEMAQDDDSGEGLNAELVYDFRAAGTYGIVASAYGRDAAGSFELLLRPVEGVSANAADGRATFVTPGSSYQGRLDATSPQADGRRYETLWYRARSGERVVATMTSSSFDTYLAVSGPTPFTGTPGRASQYREFVGDDDSGGGSDSRLEFVFPYDGVYAFRARSYGRGAQGAFTFRLERTGQPEPDRGEARRATRPGERPAPTPATPTPARRLSLDDAVALVISNSRAEGFSLGMNERQLFNSRASRELQLRDVKPGEEVRVVLLEENGETAGWVRVATQAPGREPRQMESPAMIESRELPGILMSGAQVRIPPGTPAGTVLGLEIRARWHTTIAAPVHILIFVR